MTRDDVLLILKEAEDYTSGERISERLRVSRAAVNAAVKALRAQGYEITSSTNRGYLLLSSPDILSAIEVRSRIHGAREGEILVYDEVDSTNTLLRKLAQEGAGFGTVAIADRQTLGRGRLGRSFHSPSGKGIYMSMLLRPDAEPQAVSNITAWVAVAACDAIEEVTGIRPQVKWINDLILGGKKIAGILTEMAIEGETGRIQHLITGIGVNVNNESEDFPEDIASVASSIYAETGVRASRSELAAALISHMDKMYAAWPNKKAEYLEKYRRDCITVGREVRVIRGSGEYQGFAEGIDDDFALIVRRADGTREAVFTGEASVRGLLGYV